MKRHVFRYARIHHFQNQKQRLAELDMVKLKQKLEAAITRLHALRREYLRASEHYQHLLTHDPRIAHSQHASLLELSDRILQASTYVDQCQTEWSKAVKRTTTEKQKTETFETLRLADYQRHSDDQARRHTVEVNEMLLMQNDKKVGDSRNG